LFIMSPKAVIVYECLPAWQGPASCRPSSTALPDAECSSDELSYLPLTGRRRVEDPLHDPAYTSDCSVTEVMYFQVPAQPGTVPISNTILL